MISLSGNVFTMAFIFLASVTVMASARSSLGRVIEQRTGISPEPAPAPSLVGTEYYSVPESEASRHLKGCIKKVPNGCGPRIFNYLFKKSENITSYCCKNMGSIGLECHKELSILIARIPEFIGKEEQILSRATKIVNDCLPPKPF